MISIEFSKLEECFIVTRTRPVGTTQRAAGRAVRALGARAAARAEAIARRAEPSLLADAVESGAAGVDAGALRRGRLLLRDCAEGGEQRHEGDRERPHHV